MYDTVRKGQLTSSTRFVGSDAYTSKVNFYDNLNRPTSSTVILPASEGALAVPGGYQFDTAYNLDGTSKGMTFPAAGGLPTEIVTVAYDSLGRQTRTSSGASTYVIGTDYSKTGKLQGLQMATAFTGAKKTNVVYAYETGTQRLKTATTFHDSATGVDSNAAAYSYDDAGNITQINDVSQAGTDNQCFRYDYLRRLTDAWAQDTSTCAADPAVATLGGPAPYRMNYTYDVTGNRDTETSYDAGGAVTASRNYKYAGDAGFGASIIGHRLGGVDQTGADAHTETYAYDASGNTTQRQRGSSSQTMTWDAEGELAKVSDSAEGDTTYVYTPEGDRLIRRDPGGSTLYLPGMEVRLDNGATTSKATRYYSHGGQTVAMRTSAGVTFLTSDHHGTAQLAVDAANGTYSQRRFTPFGQPRGTTTGTWPGEKGFVGGTIDASTDLTHLGAREYDPATGRFISVDPIIDAADPQQMNGYAYAHNSPITRSDPTGLYDPDCPGCTRNNGYTPTRPVADSYKQQNREAASCAYGCSGGVNAGANTGGGSRGGGGGGRPPVKGCNGVCQFMGGFNHFLWDYSIPLNQPVTETLVYYGVLDHTWSEMGDMMVGQYFWPGADPASILYALGYGTAAAAASLPVGGTPSTAVGVSRLAPKAAPPAAKAGTDLVRSADFADRAAAFRHYSKHVKGIELRQNGGYRLKPGGADMPEFSSFGEYQSAARAFMTPDAPTA